MNPDDPDAKVYQPGERITLKYQTTFKFYAVWKDITTPEPTPEPTAEPTPMPTLEPTATPEPETPQLPKTGDSAPLALWMSLIVISCLGAAAILLRGKERRD